MIVEKNEPFFYRKPAPNPGKIPMATMTQPSPQITTWKQLDIPTDREWETAYQRFETADQEIAKFKKRLVYLGFENWAKDARVVELFCGRGNGLHALAQLGFTNLEGVDLSEELLKAYSGEARLYAGDCCELLFDDDSCDIMIVQGGLHHLLHLPDDLDRCLSEIRRSLKPDGTFCMVEPWRTPFLDLVHSACESSLARRCWSKLDALAEMIEREITTYEQWLGQPTAILELIESHFSIERQKIGFGKILLRAKPLPETR